MPSQPSNLRIITIGLASLALAMGIGRFAFTPFLPMMREDGLVSVSGGGILASVHYVGYLIGAIVAASVPCAPKTLLRLSLLAIGIGTLGMGLTHDFGAWLALRWLNGVFSAWTLVLVGNYYVRYLAERDRPADQGWVFSGVGAGIALAGLASVYFMTSRIGSTESWLITGAVSLLTAAAICASLGAEIPASRPETRRREAGGSPLDWRIVVAYGTMGAGYVIPATYLPLMAREIVPAPLIFGWGWPVFGAAAFVSTILAARLQGRHADRRIWTASQAVMAAGLLLPVVLPGISAIIAAALCVGGTFMIITMTGIREAHRIAPLRDVTRHIAVMTASFATGQIVGPVFAGLVYDLTQSFGASLVIASGALVLTAIPLLGNSGALAPAVEGD